MKTAYSLRIPCPLVGQLWSVAVGCGQLQSVVVCRLEAKPSVVWCVLGAAYCDPSASCRCLSLHVAPLHSSCTIACIILLLGLIDGCVAHTTFVLRLQTLLCVGGCGNRWRRRTGIKVRKRFCFGHGIRAVLLEL